MASQQPPSPSPAEGFSVARKVMLDAVSHHLANGGPAEARRHVDALASELLKLYDDAMAAYREAMDAIARAERTLQREDRERQQQDQQNMMMTLMGLAGIRPAQVVDASVLPPKLRSTEAVRMWQLLLEQGYVDQRCQPAGLSRTESAILAYEMAQRLNIGNLWKTFGELWNRKNMRADYNEALNLLKSLEFRERLRRLLAH